MKHVSTIKLKENEWLMTPSHYQSKDIVVTYKGKKIEKVAGVIIHGVL